jgi:hypothetical protein
MDGVIESGTFKIVRRVHVTAEKLRIIAELLDIPEAERGQLISGTVYIESAPPRARRRAARSSTARGPGRRQE